MVLIRTGNEHYAASVEGGVMNCPYKSTDMAGFNRKRYSTENL